MGASQWQNWCPTDICICNFTGLPSCIHTYGHNLYMQVLDVSLAVAELVPCIYILYMQVLNECHAVTEFVSRRLTSVYMYVHVHACTVQFVCTHMDVCITMYMYILYMQVLNECHTVTEFVSGWLMSVYMYLHACNVCMHTHVRMHVQCTYTFITCRCSMGVSQLVTNIVGVLQRPYTSTCIHRCVLCSCMHTHGLRHVQCTCTLFTCRCSMDVSQLVTDRIGVLQRLYTSTCIHRCVLCSCMHTHDSTFVLQVLER